MNRTDLAVKAITPWRCIECGHALGALRDDENGHPYRDCQCTIKAREEAEQAKANHDNSH